MFSGSLCYNYKQTHPRHYLHKKILAEEYDRYQRAYVRKLRQSKVRNEVADAEGSDLEVIKEDGKTSKSARGFAVIGES